MKHNIGFILKVGSVAMLLSDMPAQAQPMPDYGFQFSTITSAGNRNVNESEGFWLYQPGGFGPIGGVDYEYRMSSTEVTAGQWFEFVRAYAPYYTGSRNDSGFTSDWIRPTSFDPNQPAGYVLEQGAENKAADMSWRFAARYVNWLQNDKRPEQTAFESGVYDTSTFIDGPNHTFQDQPTHSPDARFWIPTLDELTKATFYDPNRYGPGQEGYWQQAISRDTPAIPGYPEDGGESAAGVYLTEPPFIFPDVGAYANVQSPWGLFDTSGGVSEWTEWSNGSVRAARGSINFEGEFYYYDDRIDTIGGTAPFGPGITGLRIASTVPTPDAFIFLAVVLSVGRRSRSAS